MPKPDVSIVLAVKDEAKYIEAALDSILAQTGLSLEVLIVDDHSADDTMTLVARRSRTDGRLRSFSSPRSGKVAAFNYGIEQATGRFVCLFAGDDIMPAGSLAARRDAIKDLPNTRPVIGLCKIVTLSDDKSQDGHVVPRKPGRGALSGSSYLMNRPARDRLFPLPEQFPNEDTWLELAVSHLPGLEVVHSDVIGCAWRIHAGNSINLLAPFETFNERFTRRMAAYDEFYRRHVRDLTSEHREQVMGLVECEESRRQGNILGVLSSSVPFVQKCRALSFSNATLYGVRSRFYGLFSGW